jgi:mannosyltransferase
MRERGPIAVLILALALRAFAFWEPELWLDEYGTWWVVAAEGWSETTRRALEIQGQSPLYYWAVRASVELFGENELALRLPSVVAGAGAVAVGWRVAWRLFGDQHAALVAAVLLATNPLLLEASQDARPYSLAILAVGLSFLFHVRLLERWSWRDAAAYALASAAVFYVHYVFTVALLVQAVHVLARAEGRARAWRWLPVALAVAALCAPAMGQLGRIFARREALNWLPVESAWKTLLTALALGASLVGAQFLLLALAASVATRALREPRTARAEGWILLVLWIALPLALFAALPSALGISLLADRYLSWVALAAAIGSGWVLALGRRSAASRWAPLAVYLTLVAALELVPNLADQGTFARHYRDWWRRAAATLESRAAPGEPVFHSSGYVEQDLTAVDAPDPTRLSFVEWPLRANLRDVHELFGLPYHDGERVERSCEQARARVPQGGRLWAIGRGPAFASFVESLPGSLPARVVEDSSHGALRVVGFERTAP